MPPPNSYPNSPWICGFVHRRDLIKLQKSTNVNIFIVQATTLPSGIYQACWLANPYNKGYKTLGLWEQQEAVVVGIWKRMRKGKWCRSEIRFTFILVFLSRMSLLWLFLDCHIKVCLYMWCVYKEQIISQNILKEIA